MAEQLSFEGHVGYGGVVFAPNQGLGQSQVFSFGGGDQIVRTAEGVRNQQFNRLTVQVSPGKLRCLVNGRLFFEDTDAAPTSPWLMLASGSGQQGVFRNFTLAGKPEVVSEVKLTAGDFLDGWTTPTIAEGVLPTRMGTRVSRATLRASIPGNKRTKKRAKRLSEPVYDWVAKEGELQGRKLLQFGKSTGRRVSLYLFPVERPGRHDLAMEFFYEPGQTHVHPSLGRLRVPAGAGRRAASLDDWRRDSRLDGSGGTAGR